MTRAITLVTCLARAASRHTRRGGAAPGLLLAALLAGCAGVPVTGPGAETHGVARGPASAFELAQLQRAQEQEQQGQLADAAWTWEVLTVLRPDNAAYRDGHAAVKRRIEAGVDERWAKAQLAQKKNDLETAQREYLMVLALQPDHAQAADALRAMEKERNRRQYLGTPSRITLRRAAAESKAAAAAPARSQQDRLELEHIAMLSTQGEVDEAIALLEKRSAQDRRDPSARRLLTDLYVRKAERIAVNDRAAAIIWLQKCLKVDARHARATALMRQYIDDSTKSGPSARPAPVAGTSPAAKSATPAATAGTAGTGTSTGNATAKDGKGAAPAVAPAAKGAAPALSPSPSSTPTPTPAAATVRNKP